MSEISGTQGDEDPVQDDPVQEERSHSEAPSEGDPEFDETEVRAHAMDPAEGADED